MDFPDLLGSEFINSFFAERMKEIADEICADHIQLRGRWMDIISDERDECYGLCG